MRPLRAVTTLVWTVLLLVVAPDARPYEYVHGASYLRDLKYAPDFPHFDYVNPDAPKGGTMRYPEMGTYDSFNNILDKGRVAGGVGFLGNGNLIYDRLLERAIDEPAAYYGRLAEGVWVSKDYSQMAFRIRDGAYWHDGEPLTAADVVFTFRTLKEKGAAGIKTALLPIERIERIGDREVLFTTGELPGSHNLLFAVGAYPILPEHYWRTRDLTKTLVSPPLGSGPYRVGDFQFGRNVTLDRVDNYWARELPVNKGRYNFDHVKVDYFRDDDVMLEAQKGDVVDVRHELVSKNWMTAYDFPAVRAGYFKKELVDVKHPWGLWGPVMWNLERRKFQDIRVREALSMLSDFRWTNRVLMYSFYNYAKSFFYNSPMASSGLPSAAELALLEPWRAQIPERAFTHAWDGNETTGYGYDRDVIARALELFKEAGWELRDGAMTNVETGEPFTIDFIFVSPGDLRKETSLLDTLKMVGIATTARTPELSNWLYRMRNGKFDAASVTFQPGNTPGLMLRNRLSTASADSEGGQNWGKIRNPAIDAMIDHILAASTIEDFYAATRALDRIMLWNFYYIPALGAPGYRLVYWDRFGHPRKGEDLQRTAWLDTWWWDPVKAERLERGMAELTGK